MIEEREIHTLQPHPLNADIYNPFNPNVSHDKELIESIKEKGILVPLAVRPSGLILSGHRRWQAAKVVGLETIPCEAVEGDIDADLILTYNKYRAKCYSEKMSEYRIAREYLSKPENREALGLVPKGGTIVDSDLTRGVATKEIISEKLGVSTGKLHQRPNLSLIHISEPTRPY